MRKLSLSILAASVALVAAPVFAQGARPGHGPRPPAHGPNVMVRHGGPNVMVRHGGMHPGRNFRHRRLNRGFVIHPFWFGPQFHVNNWRMYGFADPGHDRRWVRYYDDAYLIGRDGRVEDTRYGMEWDRYGEEWDMDDGIPAYRGRGGDHEWAGGHDDDDDDSRGGHRGHGEHRGGHHEGHMMGGQGYGYGAAHGGYYGYGAYAYPIVIETVTTTGCGCQEVVEEVVEVVEVREVRRRHRRPPPRPRPPRRPPPGERG